MNKDQINMLVKGLKAAFTGEQLGEMIDRMSDGWYPGRTLETAIGAAYLTSDEVTEPVTSEPARPVGSTYLLSKDGKQVASLALYTLLTMVDGWIEGARSNHEGMSHRGEPHGGECWTQFHPEDIRRMVNDAAQKLGVPEFPLPTNGQAKEDQVR